MLRQQIPNHARRDKYALREPHDARQEFVQLARGRGRTLLRYRGVIATAGDGRRVSPSITSGWPITALNGRRAANWTNF